jgi:hypothetical protein
MSAEMEADITFLLLRAGCAGSCSFSSDRWTGQSSNALVALAYGGKQTDMPWDRSDYATAAVMAGLKAAREHYLGRYPDDRCSIVRRSKMLEWRTEQLLKLRKRNRR